MRKFTKIPWHWWEHKRNIERRWQECKKSISIKRSKLFYYYFHTWNNSATWRSHKKGSKIVYFLLISSIRIFRWWWCTSWCRQRPASKDTNIGDDVNSDVVDDIKSTSKTPPHVPSARADTCDPTCSSDVSGASTSSCAWIIHVCFHACPCGGRVMSMTPTQHHTSWCGWIWEERGAAGWGVGFKGGNGRKCSGKLSHYFRSYKFLFGR
jgi:hypothetical protein